jgi:hypothetical protein
MAAPPPGSCPTFSCRAGPGRGPGRWTWRGWRRPCSPRRRCGRRRRRRERAGRRGRRGWWGGWRRGWVRATCGSWIGSWRRSGAPLRTHTQRLRRAPCTRVRTHALSGSWRRSGVLSAHATRCMRRARDAHVCPHIQRAPHTHSLAGGGGRVRGETRRAAVELLPRHLSSLSLLSVSPLCLSSLSRLSISPLYPPALRRDAALGTRCISRGEMQRGRICACGRARGEKQRARAAVFLIPPARGPPAARPPIIYP